MPFRSIGDMTQTFRKCPNEHRAAEAEAAGLQWLGEASECVPRVVAVDPQRNELQTEYIEAVPPSPEAACRAGVELARIHAAGAPAFGAPPAGWEGPNYIGTQQQDCTPTDDWGEFYTRQRVEPFAHAAAQAGTLDDDELAAVLRACEAIRGAHWSLKPARIHGDLWTGNLLFGSEGPAFIDPAAHGGHPQTDLAMLDLFGAPHFDEIVAGYHEVSPLPKNWREFIPMHQLHPLAVHTLTHGSAYAGPLQRAARVTTQLLG